MAGAWRRLLPHPEVPGGARTPAGTPDLVQVGKLRHLAVGFRLVVPGLLRRCGSLPDRSQCDGAVGAGGDCDLAGFHRLRLDRLQPDLQKRTGQRQHPADAGPVRAAGGDGLGVYRGVLRPGGAVASGGVHRDHHVRQRVPGDHSQPEDRGRRPEGRAGARPGIWPRRQAALDLTTTI